MRHLVILCILINFGYGFAPGLVSKAGRAEAETELQETEPVYGVKEVDKSALITQRIEPGYTEEAQERKVEGIVLLGVVLSATGRVTDIAVINGLPDGLTEKAVAAARRIKFVPAVKDGRRASVRVKLAYYFVLPGKSYYGDSSKRAYYKYGCHRSIGPNDFVVFKSKKEAEASGYKKADCP